MKRVVLAIALALAATSASAHRYCQGVDAAGNFSRLVPDLNGERREWDAVSVLTMRSGERVNNIVFDGRYGTPMCSREDCERYLRGHGYGDEESANGGRLTYGCVAH